MATPAKLRSFEARWENAKDLCKDRVSHHLPISCVKSHMLQPPYSSANIASMHVLGMWWHVLGLIVACRANTISLIASTHKNKCSFPLHYLPALGRSTWWCLVWPEVFRRRWDWRKDGRCATPAPHARAAVPKLGPFKEDNFIFLRRTQLWLFLRST